MELSCSIALKTIKKGKTSHKAISSLIKINRKSYKARKCKLNFKFMAKK